MTMEILVYHQIAGILPSDHLVYSKDLTSAYISHLELSRKNSLSEKTGTVKGM